ncbi:NAD(P)-binding protein [Hymenopellis radicata]|nr:NAD(P)-binding protein [Hymenopellis radicata]
MSDTYKRVILVTGANTGIGFEIVKSLAEKGHRVYLAARKQEAGLAAQAKLVAEGLDVRFVLLDVTSPESVAAAKDVVEKAEGRLDSLVNNAGVGLMQHSSGPLTERLPNIHDAMAVNFFGLITVCQAFVPLLLCAPAGKACIVNVTTALGSTLFRASKGAEMFNDWIAYNTSKAAANSYTVSLAKTLEGKVKVNAVSPGFVSTQLNGFAPGGRTWKEGADVIAPWAEEKDRTCVFWGPDGAISW